MKHILVIITRFMNSLNESRIVLICDFITYFNFYLIVERQRQRYAVIRWLFNDNGNDPSLV